MKKVILIIIVFFLCCIQDFSTRNDPNNLFSKSIWKSKTTQHYQIYYQPNSIIARNIDSLAIVKEDNHFQLLDLLQIKSSTDKIIIFVFSNRDQFAKTTGSKADAFSISKYNAAYHYGNGGFGNHEITHLLMNRNYGEPKSGPFNRLLKEGIAYYSDENWYNIDYFDFISKLYQLDEISTPLEIVHGYGTSNKIKYNKIEGAFVKYLLKTYGFEKFIELYQNVQSEEDFKEILNVSFKQVNTDFLELIIAYNNSINPTGSRPPAGWKCAHRRTDRLVQFRKVGLPQDGHRLAA